MNGVKDGPVKKNLIKSFVTRPDILSIAAPNAPIPAPKPWLEGCQLYTLSNVVCLKSITVTLSPRNGVNLAIGFSLVVGPRQDPFIFSPLANDLKELMILVSQYVATWDFAVKSFRNAYGVPCSPQPYVASKLNAVYAPVNKLAAAYAPPTAPCLPDWVRIARKADEVPSNLFPSKSSWSNPFLARKSWNGKYL